MSRPTASFAFAMCPCLPDAAELPAGPASTGSSLLLRRHESLAPESRPTKFVSRQSLLRARTRLGHGEDARAILDLESQREDDLPLGVDAAALAALDPIDGERRDSGSTSKLR